MGYTVTVQPRTPELLQKMMAFAENFRRWSDLTGEVDYVSEIRRGKDLSYDHSPKRIGFDYGPLAPGQREYVYALVRWMAIRVGTQKNGTPQYRYDGCEWCTVDPKKYDEHGWWKPEGFPKEEQPFVEAELQFEAVIKPELERLSRLWAEQS